MRREEGRKASTAAVRLFPPPPSAVSIEYKFPPLELSHSIDRVHVCVRNWEEATTTWRERGPTKCCDRNRPLLLPLRTYMPYLFLTREMYYEWQVCNVAPYMDCKKISRHPRRGRTTILQLYMDFGLICPNVLRKKRSLFDLFAAKEGWKSWGLCQRRPHTRPSHPPPAPPASCAFSSVRCME